MKEKLERYFRDNIKIIVILLIIWAVSSFGCALVAPSLNNITFNHFPLGYYMACQGSLLVFLAVIFANAFWMDGLDRKYGFDKEAKSEADISEHIPHDKS